MSKIISFKTQNSSYELDMSLRRIRRLSGLYDPTQRQGKDGDWRAFLTIAGPFIGLPCLIVYDAQGKGTQTSRVVEVS